MFSASPTNIITENGDSYIPASQRPDGTWRKARRVKEGYVPQEEVPLYESKGKQFMNRMNSSKPENVVLPSGETAQRIIPGLYILEEKEKKPLKKKNKSKDGDLVKKLESIKITEKPTSQPKQQSNKQQSDQQQTTDPAKKLKNLKKRLREVESLEEKLKSGLIAKPEPEQLAKVQRKNDLIMQIHELEKQIG